MVMKLIVKGFIVVICVLLMSQFSVAMGQFFQFGGSPLQGKQAPDFTLKVLSGSHQNMTAYRDGQGAIIFFWATWCPHCRMALKDLNDRKDELENEGIVVISVDLGEQKRVVQSYAKKNDIEFEIFLDEDNSLSEPYFIIGVPTFILVDDQGVIKSAGHSLPSNYSEIINN